MRVQMVEVIRLMIIMGLQAAVRKQRGAIKDMFLRATCITTVYSAKKAVSGCCSAITVLEHGYMCC
jgi:hypothetical protein